MSRAVCYIKFLIAALFVVVSTYGQNVLAEESQILSVTPPLFQLSVEPGDVWQSNIKVVNGNSYPLTVYADVVNFDATGEGGQGSFTPVFDSGQDNTTLAEWIEIVGGPHVIPPEQTKDVPFFVDIPEDASPGGHYAAILISTEPSENSGDNKFAVQTSQAVTSLFFVRIEGDVEEVGSIREFAPIEKFLETPAVELSLRFENKGNVHLQPRGDILITNMWGTERGKIPVNYQTHFGNVLPDSIRNFSFLWESEFHITDIGRYTAEAVLTYGENGSKSATSITHFWVIPVKATLLTLTVVIVFVGLIVLMVRAYIRRMLSLAGVDPDVSNDQGETFETELPRAKLSAPIKDGVLDLRTQLSTSKGSDHVLKTVFGFLVKYKLFFISLSVLIIIFIVTAVYIGGATDTDKEYEVIIKNGEISQSVES